MDKIVFKVNDLKKGNGHVYRITTFLKNLSNIRFDYYEDFKKELKESGAEQLVKFESAGKYVVLISMLKNWDIVSMIFFDLQMDDTRAIHVMDSIMKHETDESIKEKLAQDFVFEYQKNKLQYEQNYSLIELELDMDEMN
ncbi:MAG: hypothetical protein M3Z26_00805 [Bacteroidota bacterium]|nr:hypothetical protein [Bacteroidota bacterium]